MINNDGKNLLIKTKNKEDEMELFGMVEIAGISSIVIAIAFTIYKKWLSIDRKEEIKKRDKREKIVAKMQAAVIANQVFGIQTCKV